MKIRAAVLREPTAPFSIEELELEDPRAGEVVVRIVAAGMCHTDLLGRDPNGFVPRPIVLGHEGAGVVERVGPGVTKVQPGDRVVLSYASCGRCLPCLQGSPQYCDLFVPLNFLGGRLDGSTPLATPSGERIAACWFGQSSFASHALVPERNIVKITADDVPLELLGPLGCGLQTGAGAVINSLGVRAGTSIAVFGVGAVGLAGVMAAKLAGCTTIIAVDLHDERLRLARELGATHTLNGRTTTDLVSEIRVLTGVGVQYVLDTTAVGSVVRQAVDALRPTGVACLVGAGLAEMVLDGAMFLFGKTVKGVIEGDAVPDDFIPKMVQWYREGRFPIEKLVRTYRLDQIEQAQHDSESGVTVKPLITF